VQFTAPSKDLHVANRELGTIVRLDERGDVAVHTDSGRLVEFQLKDHPHLDYGYAVTSYSSQGQTADRVLIHAETEESAQLVNSRMAYVAVSRGRYDAQIYTNDKSELAEHLSRDVSHRTAIETGQDYGLGAGHKIAPSSAEYDTAQPPGVAAQSQGHTAGDGHGQAVGE
jgi:ATP-dependent exoDNAse (exonuclease V) alpha subunit